MLLLLPSIEPPPPPLPGGGGEGEERSRLKLGTILVVEDDPDIRETLVDLLQYEGYPVAAVTNGKEALGYLRSNPHPDLVLLDLMMPVMSGWEFCVEQQRDPELAAIPVVVLSGVHDLDHEIQHIRVAGRLPKPVEVMLLFETVRRFCG